ncbi:IS1249 family transposase [Glutamicibacter endophyticus]|uniref:IS1249 family transposase n=1 Tax=Glutamicibacter endophyticus TaxID=1522174 RepID=UPI003AF0B9E8
MVKVENQPRCGVCGTKQVKNGKTSAGRTRWRCKNCGASSTQRREDITARKHFTAFYQWATGKQPAARWGTSRATFQRTTAWCWSVHPTLEPTGEIHRYLMLDGTYVNGFCVLTAYNGRHITDWQFCDREKTASWTLLLQRIPAPQVVIVDGNGPLASVIKQLWPETRVQRCYFHIRQNIHKHLTRHPRTLPGQQLLVLVKALTKVSTLTESVAWEEQFHQWHAMHQATLKARTYAKHVTGQRPAHVKQGQTWWYTHLRLRRAAHLIDSLLRERHLFTWLEDTHHEDREELPRTTSPLEGAVNAPIKEILRAHRGLSADHAMTLLEWHLYQHTQDPKDPYSFVRPEHWQKAASRTIGSVDPDPGPELYGAHFSWEDGNGLRKGWSGRA